VSLVVVEAPLARLIRFGVETAEDLAHYDKQQNKTIKLHWCSMSLWCIKITIEKVEILKCAL
jgi:hypothetical protein